MLFRRLGSAGPMVSAIGYGCMGMSEFYGKSLSREEGARVVRAAFYDHEINFFDTADMYGNGHSEQVLGKAILSFRDKVILATKCGIDRKDGGFEICNTIEYIKNSCHASLKRLKSSYIDIYYLHRYNPKTPIEESMIAMKELLAEGKILAVGLSEVDADIIRRAHSILGNKLVAVQTEFSLANRKPAEAVLPTCRELGISFVAYSPIARGLLTGRYHDPSYFDNQPEYDCRKDLPQFMSENIQSNLRFVEAIKYVAEQKGCTVGQLSLAWLLAQGENIIPIPGTNNFLHLKENMEATSILLSNEDHIAIDEAYQQNPIRGLRMPEPLLKAFSLEF